MSQHDEAIQRMAERVAPMFEAQGWTYGLDAKTPTADVLAETIRFLVESVRENAVKSESGRFLVERQHDGSVEVSLSFTLGWLYDNGTALVKPS